MGTFWISVSWSIKSKSARKKTKDFFCPQQGKCYLLKVGSRVTFYRIIRDRRRLSFLKYPILQSSPQLPGKNYCSGLSKSPDLIDWLLRNKPYGSKADSSRTHPFRISWASSPCSPPFLFNAARLVKSKTVGLKSQVAAIAEAPCDLTKLEVSLATQIL